MPDGREPTTVNVIGSIAEIEAAEWDACAGAENPFCRHGFLSAMEDSGSVNAETGWMPRHLAVRDEAGGLIAAAPLYLKSHSYGEYVFDWGWAEAYERAGGRYYPKLLSAIPFTPATGRRLLVRDDITDAVKDDLALGEGTGVFGPKAPVRQIAPPVKAAYGRMSRALRREDTKTNVGVAWAGAYQGPSRDADLLLEGQPGRGPEGRGGMAPQELALSSSLGLANLNMEQGFTFPWNLKTGSPAYPEEEIAKFKEVGWRKSYVEREGQNVPLDDECVEVVSLTKKGPIYKSTGLPGCP